ncbi:unnamed protein product [Didymodactylos carnosus]|uniref:Cytochrome P450 n=1 Tax=Didymodactylos carnosus TaxID=1234261 RepID=A0A815V0N4_9BILA|nr:unnamed protein product [Didymodactylos carnosus]CAF4385468.1 unnamed protein product [Didymodactylos carnosus]
MFTLFSGFANEELLDEILFLTVAAVETTSTALSWFIFYMSKYPHVQQKIKQELLANNITKRTYLTSETVDKLVYVDCVLKELFRFAPNVDITVRTVIEEDEIENVKLNKGDTIFISFSNIHKDKRYWNIDPNQFLPERFLNEDKNHSPYALLPFGGGHRQCPGQDFARLELKIIISRLMQFVTFTDGGEKTNKGGYKQRFTVTPQQMAVHISFD